MAARRRRRSGAARPGSRCRSRMAGDDAVVALALRSPSGSHARAPAGSRSSCAPERRTARVRRFSLASPDQLADVDLERRRRADSRASRPRLRPWSSRCVLRAARNRRLRRSGRAARQGPALALVTPGWPSLRGERPRAPSGRPPRARRARGTRHRSSPVRWRAGSTSPTTAAGRVYAARVQAAELAVRTARGLDGVADLELVEADGATVRFRDAAGREHVAVVEQRVGPTVPASCGAEPEPQAGFVARVV